jgi:hypothetical protein
VFYDGATARSPSGPRSPARLSSCAGDTVASGNREPLNIERVGFSLCRTARAVELHAESA